VNPTIVNGVLILVSLAVVVCLERGRGLDGAARVPPAGPEPDALDDAGSQEHLVATK
jgi:hypothetical protein